MRDPTHDPTPVAMLHPGHRQMPFSWAHCWQVVAVGVPTHVGAVAKSTGAGGSSWDGDLQQI
jgi:hypothetical protein